MGARDTGRTTGVDARAVPDRLWDVEPSRRAPLTPGHPARPVVSGDTARLDPVRVRVEVLKLVQADAQHGQHLEGIATTSRLSHQEPGPSPQAVPFALDTGGVDEGLR